MFSIFTRDEYSDNNMKSQENLLDVLHHAGVNILWRDNNSDSKGTALRVPYEDYKSPSRNPICDVECRDEGMLVGLQEYIDRTKYGDILIVLHQMGNHGPAYFKRYPKEFEKPRFARPTSWKNVPVRKSGMRMIMPSCTQTTFYQK
jgi:lipid A ethanolaminephosphotransferase